MQFRVWYVNFKGENMMSVDGFPNLTWKNEPLEVKLQPVITDLDIKAQEYD